jgi:Fe-S-cluster-containing dehydrogenase component
MPKLLRVINREQCIGCYSCMLACSRTWFAHITVEKAALRVRNYAGAEGLFSIRACYGCEDPDCAQACPTQALTTRTGGGIQFKPDLCTKCGACVDACTPQALQWDHERAMPLPCHQCSACVNFCPNQVLGMVEATPGGK